MSQSSKIINDYTTTDTDPSFRVKDLKPVYESVSKSDPFVHKISTTCGKYDMTYVLFRDNTVRTYYHDIPVLTHSLDLNTYMPVVGPGYNISSISVSPNGKYIAFGTTFGYIYMFEIDTVDFKYMWTFNTISYRPTEPKSRIIMSIAFSPDSKFVYAPSGRYILKINSTVQGFDCVGHIPGDMYTTINKLYVTDRRIVTSTTNNSLFLMDTSGYPVQSLMFTSEIDDMFVSPDHTTLSLIVSKYDTMNGIVYLFNMYDLTPINQILTPHIPGSKSIAMNHKYLFTGGYGGHLCIWDWHTCELVHSMFVSGTIHSICPMDYNITLSTNTTIMSVRF